MKRRCKDPKPRPNICTCNVEIPHVEHIIRGVPGHTLIEDMNYCGDTILGDIMSFCGGSMGERICSLSLHCYLRQQSTEFPNMCDKPFTMCRPRLNKCRRRYVRLLQARNLTYRRRSIFACHITGGYDQRSIENIVPRP